MKGRNEFYTAIALIAGILIMLNVLSDQFFLRFDLTEDDQYTLSDATLDILDDLTEPVTVRAYFSENLPPDIARTRTEFRDLLVEYANRSDDLVVYEFINPNETDQTEMEAMQAGISPVMINVRERDQMRQQRAFLGAVVQLGDQSEVIPFLQAGAPMEYALSTGIKKLAVTEKPSIALLQGHGEPTPAEMQQAQQALSVLYNLEPLTLTDTSAISPRFRTIAMVAPTDSIPPSHFAQLDAFLAEGGNMLVALNRVDAQLNQGMGSAVNTGLETWLASKGIEIDQSFVIDVNCASIGVQQQQGPFRFTNQISFPYLPIVSTFADHPITEGLEAVIMQFASPITFTGDSSFTFTPIALTSAQSGTQPAPVYFDINRQWEEADFPLEALTVGAVVEGPLAGETSTSMVIIGDGDFAVNGSGQQAQALQPDNVSLLVNGIDWLSDDTGLIELRTKGAVARPIAAIEDGTKTMLKYLNFLLPILLVIVYGVFRAQSRRTARMQRMSMNFDT